MRKCIKIRRQNRQKSIRLRTRLRRDKSGFISLRRDKQNKGIGQLQPVDGLRRKVVFCAEYATGVYYVLDCCGAEARREITRKPPPPVRFSTKNKTQGKTQNEY